MIGSGPRAAALDADHLARQTAGDLGLEREVLALFMQQAARLAPIVAGTSDPLERADAAHTLRGAALAIGARRVADLLGTIEASLDGGKPGDTLARLVRKLETALAEVNAAIALRWQRDAA